MKLNAYFFKKHLHTLRRKFFEAFYGLKKAMLKLSKRLAHTENMRLWFRENIPLKDGKFFLKTHYVRLVVRNEYTKRDFMVLFIIAFFVGVAGKTAATETVTIGFEDYKLPPKEALIDLNAVQKKIAEKSNTFIEDNGVRGGVCSE